MTERNTNPSRLGRRAGLLALALGARLAAAASGVATTDFGGDIDRAYAAVRWPGGRIVAAGWARTSTFDDFGVVRYRWIDGALDASFGSGTGKVTTDFFGVNDRAFGVARIANRVVAAGSAAAPGILYAAVARYTSHGTTDFTFNGTGKLTTTFGDPVAEFRAVGGLAGGHIVAAGYSGNLIGSNNTHDFAVVAYDKTGAELWKDKIPFYGPDRQAREDVAMALAVQRKDDRIVVGGSTLDSNDPCNATVANFALTRLNDNGSLDFGFGNGGRVVTDLGGIDTLNAVALQPDGKIVAAGWTLPACGGQVSIGVVRYNSDGTLDPTFGTGGIAVLDFDPTLDEYATSVDIAHGGGIVVAGYAQATGGVGAYDMLVTRLDTTGTPDPTFGSAGVVRIHHGGPDDGALAQSVVVGPSDSILPVGYCAVGLTADQDFMIARLDASGVLAPTFGQ